MRISTRGEYGVRAMLDLALHHGEGPVPLKTIASRQSISEHYLEQLMGALRKAGLVNSIRGAQGGYRLAEEPSETRVGDILRALEGPIAPMECVEDNKACSCDQSPYCVTRGLWKRLRETMEELLDKTTLEHLRQEAMQLPAVESLVFHI